jgi:hypothetical protein
METGSIVFRRFTSEGTTLSFCGCRSRLLSRSGNNRNETSMSGMRQERLVEEVVDVVDNRLEEDEVEIEAVGVVEDGVGIVVAAEMGEDGDEDSFGVLGT